ncbi:MAG: AAA family ATPase [Alistipes sp.]|nr:AAA family ATPase [Alistipes sp.]
MLNTHISHQIYAKLSFDATNNQKKIIEKLSQWLSDDDFERIFLLNGYAGTGKTTIIAAFVAALKELGIKPILLAPTGRAAKVLTRYSLHTAYTIHKKIYRERTLADYESRFSLDYNREHDAVFIVDEASMLSASTQDGATFGSGNLLEDLVTYVRSGKRCRLLLVGDDAQLPPVGDDFSPALDPATLLPYGDVEYGTMDEVVRQSQDSGILFNATMLRCMLENNIHEIPLFDMSFEDFRSVQGSELIEALQDCYDRYGRDETIVITRSNKRANRFNEGIRRHNLSAEEEIESGDMLMVVKNNYHYAEKDDNTPMAFIANGDVVRLRRLRRFEELYGFRFANAVLEFPDYDGYELEAKILLDTISSESPSLTREQSRELFYEIEKDYLDITAKSKRYKAIRENEHFNALQIKFAYAVTCHKAQGGQWSAVFVDRCLFGDEPMTRDMLRWLYTAITRATERVYLVNFDERFFEG